MAATPPHRPSLQTAPSSSFRRSFTAPLPKLATSPQPTHVDPLDAAADILYSHSSTKTFSFSPPGIDGSSKPASRDFDYPVDAIETLRWTAPLETMEAKGLLIIEKVAGSAIFLKTGKVVHAILKNSQCWCVDGDSKFVLRVRQFKYYRIELPNTAPGDKQKIEELKSVLSKILRFEVTPCPFMRDFKVELSESEITPKKKRAWKPRQSFTATSPLSISSLDRRTSTASISQLSMADTESVDETDESRPVSRANTHSTHDGESEEQPVLTEVEVTAKAISSSEGEEDSEDQESEELDEDEESEEGDTEAEESSAFRSSPDALMSKGEESSPSLNFPTSTVDNGEDPPKGTITSVDHRSETVAPGTTTEHSSGPDESIANRPPSNLTGPSKPEFTEGSEESNSGTDDSDEESDQSSEKDSDESPDVDALTINTMEGEPRPNASYTQSRSEEPDLAIDAPDNESFDEEEERGNDSSSEAEDSDVVDIVQDFDVPQERHPQQDVTSFDSATDGGDTLSSPNKTGTGTEETLEVSRTKVEPHLVASSSMDEVASSAASFRSVASFRSTGSSLSASPSSSNPSSPDTNVKHKRQLSQITIKAPTSSRSDSEASEDSPPLKVTYESPSTEEGSDPEIPAPPGSFILRRRRAQRSGYSPLPPAATLLTSPRTTNDQVATAVIQKAASFAIVKPVEAFILLLHVFGRIAAGATVNDLLSGDLFRRPTVHSTSPSRSHNSDPDETLDEDDYGDPIRGRRRSTAATSNDIDSDLD
ncbi:hypothetical protein UCRPC4_g03573 [Phaeomoniella chlamydospora]|uniref:Inheritance of peroxisomes protein 1 n=1 Tax=Phaeomoniella chlamydospora TaxID=158046 RepID=A0A0G2EFG3_PHACM|nr:hypothetical protein UCRPC4_g03573 [Phaeomoniella chlamydospora]